MFVHIVVPVDGSPEANVAVTQAAMLAGLTGATITLVHAVASSQAVGEGTALVAAIALRHSASDLRIDAVARDGDAASVILEEVRSRGADLVVMRTRGRAGLSRAVLGSVAERIVKHSPVPVWLLPPGVRAASALGVILVPVDSSPGGALALGIARQLATQSAGGARLRLLQVVVPIPLYLGRDAMLHAPIYIDPSWDELAREAARGYVTSLASQLRANGVQADGDIVVDGSVPDAIVNAAALYAADLIVMSSEAHTGVTRALLGSVTDAVVRSAACPILVIRRTAETDAPPQGDEALTAAAAPPGSAGR
jgi:nucleotide-binding universal stress UspA family protein